MAKTKRNLNWKSLYAAREFYKWQRATINGRDLRYRRLGIVENAFDTDGVDFEGRADINVESTINLETMLTDDEVRQRILLAWACLRGSHPLLACKSLYAEEFLPGESGRLWLDKHFVYERPATLQEFVASAQQHMVFVQDAYPELDIKDFFAHLMNTARVVDEKQTMSKLFVMPLEGLSPGTIKLTLILVVGHEVSDGITLFRLYTDLIDLLNTTEQDLRNRLALICSEQGDSSIVMPPPQESVYPVYAPNAARDRWNWAITRILRHVRKPPPAAFQNPLHRDAPLETAIRMPEHYAQVLDYTRAPPLNASIVKADLSRRASDNLVNLCRQAGISVGSGAFTLVGIIMMRLEEARHPDTPLSERLPFVGSFPVNPRPFLSGPSTIGKEDSLMLAFSDGVTLPFVPSDLDFRKTFRVLGRLAHRQLRQYQKRKRSPAEEAHLGSRSPRELLPALYLTTMERVNGMVKPEQRVDFNPQGAYPARKSQSLATCGISSVGDRSALMRFREYDSEIDHRDLKAEIKDLMTAVRPRDGEFLVGTIGTKEGMQFRVSYDSSNLDPLRVEAWKEAIKSILDFDLEAGPDVRTGVDAAFGRQSKL